MTTGDRCANGVLRSVVLPVIMACATACSPSGLLTRFLSEIGGDLQGPRIRRAPRLEAEGYTVAWIQEGVYSLHNFGDALMVSSGGVVAVLAYVGYLRTHSVVAYDAMDGEVLWKAWSGFASVLAGSTQGVLIGTRDGVIALHEPRSGDVIWSTSVRGSGGILRLGVVDEVVYAYSRPGSFHTLDLESGTELPQPVTHGLAYPFLMDGSTIIGASSPDSLMAMEAGSAEELWFAAIGEAFYERPVFSGTSIAVRSGRTLGYIWVIERDTGRFVWQSDRIVVSNISAMGDSILALTEDARLVGFNLGTGTTSAIATFGPEPFDVSGEEEIGGYYTATDPGAAFVFILLGDSGQLIALSKDAR